MREDHHGILFPTHSQDHDHVPMPSRTHWYKRNDTLVKLSRARSHVSSLTQSINPTTEYTDLCDQLDDTTGLLDLLLSLLAHISRSHDDWDLWQTTLSEDLGVSEGEEIEDGSGILLGALGVLVSGFLWQKSPELVEVDGGFPELVLSLVEAELVLVWTSRFGVDMASLPGALEVRWKLTISYRLYPVHS